jgi:regulator of replication initiation timing
MVAGMSAQADEKGAILMERAPEGFEQIASALLEMQQRMQALIAENRQLQEELAALRRGVGITVVIEGQAYPLATSLTPSVEPIHSPF